MAPVARSRSTPPTPSALCDAQHIGALDGEPVRATQDIAPRVRRFVVRRDRGRCRVPGCRSAANLELHHIVPRSRGGSHEASNLIQLCDGCHTAHHRGLIDIAGTSDDLVVTRRHVFGPAELEDRAHVGVDPDRAYVDTRTIDRTHVGARHRPGVFDRVPRTSFSSPAAPALASGDWRLWAARPKTARRGKARLERGDANRRGPQSQEHATRSANRVTRSRPRGRKPCPADSVRTRLGRPGHAQAREFAGPRTGPKDAELIGMFALVIRRHHLQRRLDPIFVTSIAIIVAAVAHIAI
jgi:hypothetical protein